MAFNADKYLETINQASVSTPPAGDVRIYSKSDKMPYMKNDTGREYPLVASGNLAFTDLTDVPSSYSTMSASGVRVNSGATGLEFFDLDSVINSAHPTGAITWDEVPDPVDYNVNGIKLWAGGGYDPSVILALRFDEEDGSRYVIDSSPYHEPSITRYVYPTEAAVENQHDESTKPFGRSSYRLSCDNSSNFSHIEVGGEYNSTLYRYNRTRWGVYTAGGSVGDLINEFTISFWIRFNTVRWAYLFDFAESSGNTVGVNMYTQAAPNPIVCRVASTTFTTGYVPATLTWYHMALTRDSSSNVRFFVDGVQKGGTQNITQELNMSESHHIIGDYRTCSQAIDGWIKDFVVIKKCLWTSDFTRPTTYVTTMKTLNVMSSNGQIITLP